MPNRWSNCFGAGRRRGQSFDTPERRAGLDVRLRAAIGLIKNQSLQRHYGEALAVFRRELFRARNDLGSRWSKGRRGFAEAPVAPLASTRALAGQLSGESLRMALILTTLCRYPALIDEFEGRIERLEPSDRAIASLALFLAGHRRAQPRGAARGTLRETDISQPLKASRRWAICGSHRFLSGHAEDIGAARTCLEEELTKQAAAQAWESELNEATHDVADGAVRRGQHPGVQAETGGQQQTRGHVAARESAK